MEEEVVDQTRLVMEVSKIRGLDNVLSIYNQLKHKERMVGEWITKYPSAKTRYIRDRTLRFLDRALDIAEEEFADILRGTTLEEVNEFRRSGAVVSNDDDEEPEEDVADTATQPIDDDADIAPAPKPAAKQGRKRKQPDNAGSTPAAVKEAPKSKGQAKAKAISPKVKPQTKSAEEVVAVAPAKGRPPKKANKGTA
eukprot:TRINITY_DN27273_c0_g1_i1.p1 TRINITY_DN27273_c0_g1~~TRINITY_DN27273_c0_g1_i1.p1  ORF type:complete len:218 (-),score=55.26 TRINITY_DN27273_c0_g1_i1:86-673(-)